MEGKPTFEATHCEMIAGAQQAMKMSKLLIGASIFHVVEPLPDDNWMFFVKEEAAGLLKGFEIIANTRR